MDKIPAHMREALSEYIARGRPVGDFLRAVLSNDLRGAMARADSINAEHLRDYVHFLFNTAPAGCWGSPAKVDAWIKLRGLEGLRLELIG